MELNTISNTGTWGNSANRLNENFSKVNTEVEKLKNATTKNKGYFKTDALLKQTHQTAYYGDIAYVGTSYPYQIWTWNGTNWEDSKSTGGSETVNLGNYYTREDIDTQQHQQDDSLAAITEKQTEQEKKILSVEKTLENLEVAGVDVASADKLGGIKAETKTDAETAEAKIDPETGKLYVPAGGNNPDNEDLFLEKDENTQKEVMKFADKEYNAAGFSGLGRVYLRRNISVSKNVLTQDVMSKANTRYIIQYDYDLNGSTINIPENCILCFEGGSLKNGALNGNKTVIVSPPKKIFDKTLVLSGHFVGTAYVEYYGCYADIDSTDNDVCDAITALYKGFSDIKLLEGTYYTYKGGCRITSLSGQSKTTTIVHFHASKNEDYLFSMGYLDDLSNINYRERFLRLGNMRMIVEGSLASTRLEKCSGLLLGMIGNSEISNVRVDLFQENMKLSSVSEIKAAMESKDEEDKLNAAIRFIGYAELLKFDDIEPYGTIGIKAEGLLLDAISFRDCTIIGGSTGYASCLFNCQVMNVTFGGFNSWNQFTYGLKATNSVQGTYWRN
jgi:hypothetical protein